MALQLSFEAFGAIFPSAYARIGKVVAESPVNEPKNVAMNVCVYASKYARDGGSSSIWGPQGFQVQRPAVCQPDVTEENPTPAVVMECAVDPNSVCLTELYNWLKTQEMFKNSQDV